ncbi:MAG TPA: YciI family protein [Vicinamibacterales bacterium]|nr:YciI family protein [Vicinamibacterales bacterium]
MAGLTPDSPRVSIPLAAVRPPSEKRPYSRRAHSRRHEMRVMVIVKANKESEAGQMPDEKILAAMGKYNEQLVNAGVMKAGEGLHPSSKGKRVKFSGANRTVIDGPFAETKELIGGFWLWTVKSMDEAVEWLKRAPFDGGTEVEIRPLFETEDFGKEFTPELRAQEQRLREKIGESR